jgi:membrane protease YdiL (CAAX protease family)
MRFHIIRLSAATLSDVYLGVAHVPRGFFMGLVLALLAYFSGSLWPAIVLHAAIDWNSGELGYAVLSKPEAES